jgi:hypothetical protein
MKVKVRRLQNGRGDVFYQPVEKDHRGARRIYSDAEYKANPAQFEVVGGLKESQRISIHEIAPLTNNLTKPKLTRALREFNDLAFAIAALHPHWSDAKIAAKVAEAEAANKTQEDVLTESWKERGLNEPGARIAAREQRSMAPAANDQEFWSKFNFGR